MRISLLNAFAALSCCAISVTRLKRRASLTLATWTIAICAASMASATSRGSTPSTTERRAFKRAGDPNVGEFSDAVVLKRFGDVPEDLSEL